MRGGVVKGDISLVIRWLLTTQNEMEKVCDIWVDLLHPGNHLYFLTRESSMTPDQLRPKAKSY